MTSFSVVNFILKMIFSPFDFFYNLFIFLQILAPGSVIFIFIFVIFSLEAALLLNPVGHGLLTICLLESCELVTRILTIVPPIIYLSQHTSSSPFQLPTSIEEPCIMSLPLPVNIVISFSCCLLPFPILPLSHLLVLLSIVNTNKQYSTSTLCLPTSYTRVVTVEYHITS